MKKCWITTSLLVMGLALLGGCAGNKGLTIPEKRMEQGGKKPAMLKKGIVHEYDRKAGVYRFMGTVTEASALDIGQDVAEAHAMSRLVQQLYQKARNEVLRSVSGTVREEMEGFFNRTFVSVSSSVPLSGAGARRTYWERYVRDEFGHPRDYYNVWIIVEITEDDFNRAKAYMMSEMAREARVRNNARAEELAQGALERLLEVVE